MESNTNELLKLNEILINNINELSAVYHLANELINLDNLSELYQLVIDNITKIVGFKRAAIYKINIFKNELELGLANFTENIDNLKYFKLTSDVKYPFLTSINGESKIFSSKNNFLLDAKFANYFNSENFAVVPLKSKKSILGLIIVDNENSPEEISIERFDTLKLTANVASFGMENIILKTELKTTQDDLYNYIDIISRQYNLISRLNNTRSIAEIYNVILNRLNEEMNLSFTFILLHQAEEKKFNLISNLKIINDNIKLLNFNYLDGNDYLTKSIKTKVPYNIIMNEKESFRYGRNISLIQKVLSADSIVVIPIMGKQNFIGVFIAGKTAGKIIKTEDFDEMRMFLNQAGVSLENEQLNEKINILNNQLQSELQTASQIQQSLLTKNFETFNNLDIYAENIQASKIGGDFYILNKIKEDEYFIAIGDVCGHGPAAALVMALLIQIYNEEILVRKNIKEIMRNVNRKFMNAVKTELTGFVTSFAVNINLKENKLCYSNAGHNFPYFFSAKENRLHRFAQPGYFFGLDENSDYENVEIRFDKCDVLVLYTDGITEALNEQSEQFGECRLENIIKYNIDLSAVELKNIIIEEANKFIGSKEQNDDWTLVIIKF